MKVKWRKIECLKNLIYHTKHNRTRGNSHILWNLSVTTKLFATYLASFNIFTCQSPHIYLKYFIPDIFLIYCISNPSYVRFLCITHISHIRFCQPSVGFRNLLSASNFLSPVHHQQQQQQKVSYFQFFSEHFSVIHFVFSPVHCSATAGPTPWKILSVTFLYAWIFWEVFYDTQLFFFFTSAASAAAKMFVLFDTFLHGYFLKLFCQPGYFFESFG